MARRRKILFITPRATREGSGIFMLRFLRWLRINTTLDFEILCGYGGAIEKDYRKLARTLIFRPENQSGGPVVRAVRKVGRRIGFPERLTRARIRKMDISMIFSNTVVNGETLSIFSDYKMPVITMCHEMETVIRRNGLSDFRKTCELTDHFIAISKAVSKELTDLHGIPKEDVTTIHGFIPIPQESPEEVEVGRSIRKMLGLPNDAFIVGGSGTLEWRKSPDLFLQIAMNIQKRRKELPIFFVWVGGAHEGESALFEVRHQIKKLGLADRVIFLEHKSDPLRYFSAFDVFAMVSREDPFPLVCLEAASYGKPVICFENAGGTPEFVGEDRGFVVPFLDTDKFAERILELYENPALTARMGTNAGRWIRTNHDIESGAPKVLSKMAEYLDSDN